MVPKAVSTYFTPEWREMLGRLEEISFSLLGLDDNGGGWWINAGYGFLDFVSRLDEFFFNDLHSVRKFYFEAPEECSAGLRRDRQVPLAIFPGQMPLLESLHLSVIFIGPELLTFLRGHLKALKCLELNNCMSDVSQMTIDGISWATFFRQMRETRPEMTSFVVTNTNAKWFCDKFGPLDQMLGFHEMYGAIRRDLEENLGRRAFAYARLDNKYAICDVDHEQNIDAFQLGDDQREYDALQELVRSNANFARLA